MKMLNFFCQRATLYGGVLLLCFGLTAHADEIQDINKLFKQGQHEQALGRINTYLTGKPKDAQARFLKGLILTEQGKTNDAIRIFTELTEDYPELPEPYNNLAVLYAGQGQYDKARMSLEMAIKTHPSYAIAHENLGDIYAKMASQAYDHALQLDRSNASTKTKLALIKDLFTGPAKNNKSNSTLHNIATDMTSPAKSQPAAEETVPSHPGVAPVATSAPEKTDVTVQKTSTAAELATTKKPAVGNSSEVLKVVNGWAAAWSSRNVKRYIAFYADDFKTPGGISRTDWEAQRHERISKPKSIHVGISGPKVEIIDDNHASVSFKQSYRASHLKTTSSKTLMLVKSGGNWLIQEEHSGK